MKGDDTLGQCKAQPKTAGITCPGTSVEGLEDLGDIFGGDDAAAIDDPDEDLMMIEGQVDCRLFVRRILTAVLHQVLDGDVQEFAVAENDKILFIFGELAKFKLNI